MSKKKLGIIIQIVGLILWIIIPVSIVPWKAFLGIGIIIAGGVVFRKGKSEE